MSIFNYIEVLGDGVVDVNVLVDLTKKFNKTCLIFKVDLKKNYDSICWWFLDYTFIKSGFNNKWPDCVFSRNLFVSEWLCNAGE